MSFRPDGKRGKETEPFWSFFLEPEQFIDDEKLVDRTRLAAFKSAAGLGNAEKALSNVPDEVVSSTDHVKRIPPTQTATNLFKRVAGYDDRHIVVLLKASADLIVARYLMPFENWKRRREEWLKEKEAWEKKHPQLTEDAISKFNRIFKDLGVDRKNPRVCTWEQLQKGNTGCLYNGERFRIKNHAQLCVKYLKFRANSEANKYFEENVRTYLAIRQKNPHLHNNRKKLMELLLKKEPQAHKFSKTWWADYLQALGITEGTVARKGNGDLPHCPQKNDDKEPCPYNEHTEKCKLYKARLSSEPRLQELDSLYREWRKDFLSGPKKPSFTYPSKRRLSIPKIFGKDYYGVDYKHSILRLRMDTMAADEFIPFGFHPWPPEYDIQPGNAEISSVQIHFIGSRARVGFRFKVEHKQSRFAVSQDDIADLRSRKYPRWRQDNAFLREARKLLLESFSGDPEKELKILCVDTGQVGNAIALFNGRQFQKSEKLKTLKLDKLIFPDEKSGSGSNKKPYSGLTKDHIGRHLEAWAAEASQISQKRSPGKKPASGTDTRDQPQLGPNDMRRFSLHIRWMIRDWARLVASRVIKKAEENDVDLIVFESQRGFPLPGYDKVAKYDSDKKRRLAFYAHGRVRHKVTEKAVERGMRVVTTPYFYSSQTCSECGRKQGNHRLWRTNKGNGSFICEYDGCNNRMDCDENAAKVLGRVFWGDIVLPDQ